MRGEERLIRIVLFMSASVIAVFIGLENLAHVAAVLGLALAGSAIALKDVVTSLRPFPKTYHNTNFWSPSSCAH